MPMTDEATPDATPAPETPAPEPDATGDAPAETGGEG
jgi:hypothetical protein